MGQGQEIRDRVCDAALECVARWGLTKTTLEDVAREAGCGRATIYRTFQGGKQELLRAVLHREVDRFRTTVDDALATAGDDAEDVLVAGVVAAARFLEGHDALAYLIEHEPDLVLPHVAFDRMGPLLDGVAAFAAPRLAPFVGGDPDAAARAAEWLARVVLSYVAVERSRVDLADEPTARHLIRTFVLPGLRLTADARVPINHQER